MNRKYFALGVALASIIGIASLLRVRTVRLDAGVIPLMRISPLTWLLFSIIIITLAVSIFVGIYKNRYGIRIDEVVKLNIQAHDKPLPAKLNSPVLVVLLLGAVVFAVWAIQHYDVLK